MKALITVSILAEVDSREQAEEIRDEADRGIWSSYRDTLARHDISHGEASELVVFFPATCALQP